MVVRNSAPVPFVSGEVEHPGTLVLCDKEIAGLELLSAVKHGCGADVPVLDATQFEGLISEAVVKSSVSLPGAACTGTTAITVLSSDAKTAITRMRAVFFTDGAPSHLFSWWAVTLYTEQGQITHPCLLNNQTFSHCLERVEHGFVEQEQSKAGSLGCRAPTCPR